MVEEVVAGAYNAVIDNNSTFDETEDDFSPRALTPENPPVRKGKTENANADIIMALSELINSRST